MQTILFRVLEVILGFGLGVALVATLWATFVGWG
jgi:hypothetical protein